MTKQPVDSGELHGAVQYTKGSLLLASESSDNQMVRTAQNEIYFQEDIPLKRVIQQIESVTPEELRQLAAELYRSNRMVLTLLGPVDPPKAAFEQCLFS